MTNWEQLSKHANPVVALYWLANYFGVLGLTLDLDHLLPNDICHCANFLVNAMKLQLPQIVNAVVSRCADNFFAR
jgi:hypothetical protein